MGHSCKISRNLCLISAASGGRRLHLCLISAAGGGPGRTRNGPNSEEDAQKSRRNPQKKAAKRCSQKLSQKHSPKHSPKPTHKDRYLGYPGYLSLCVGFGECFGECFGESFGERLFAGFSWPPRRNFAGRPRHFAGPGAAPAGPGAPKLNTRSPKIKHKFVAPARPRAPHR